MRSDRLGRFVIVAVGVASFSLAALACSGAGQKTPTATQSPAGSAASAGASADAGSDGGPKEKPFAGSAMEATQLVSAAIDQNRDAVGACVSAYRKRKNLAHARIEVQVGIDQEGNLLGATLGKGKADEELSTCIQRALANAPFPRSHSGVISVTKVYEEILR